MPELPEVEGARAAIAAAALHRPISSVDDTDTYECRPHQPGEIATALIGRTLTAVHRRGKALWCDTSPLAGSSTPGPVLGLHLGMSGRILVTGPDGAVTEGGDYLGPRVGSASAEADEHPGWVRFRIGFRDGGSLRLFDKRRLGRVVLDPDLDRLGPDAHEVDRATFAARVGAGRAPVKARLLDQGMIAGVGNLLADETLWQAGIHPGRRVNQLADDDLDRLYDALRAATDAALEHGGVHTGEVIEHRRAGGRCPRCGSEMVKTTVGGRSTWSCPVDQT
ncbi:MAG: Fpg/Nei family DNA glycosylase [Acidimicrobiales bacterium]